MNLKAIILQYLLKKTILFHDLNLLNISYLFGQIYLIQLFGWSALFDLICLFLWIQTKKIQLSEIDIKLIIDR